MKRILLISVCLALVASLAIAKNATNGKNPGDLNFQIEFKGSRTDRSNSGISQSPAQGTTTWLANYTFDQGPACVNEGWTEHDITAQTRDYWHVSDFTTSPEGCGPGSFGDLVALEGSQSLWCGVCSEPGPAVCGYTALPGYGNNWKQAWCTNACLTVDTAVVIDALVRWDSEPGRDITTLEIDNCDDNWVEVQEWSGNGDGSMSVAIPNEEHEGILRIRFYFESDGGWSDEDGLWDTDGAFILDSLSVSDASGVVLAVEDFEGEANGATSTIDWTTCNPPGYDNGNPAGELTTGLINLQEDPCIYNPTCLWDFYENSTYDYSCNNPPAPWQRVIPYVNERNQYISSEIWSPPIPLPPGTGAVVDLTFDVYRDLKLDALVFYVWHVRSTTAGCPSAWADRGKYYHGDGKDWHRAHHAVGDLLDLAGGTDISIALGVVDMCRVWCGVYGTGTCHSHAPLFDNVEVYRVNQEGPQFAWRDIDQFQDNFSADGTTTGTARIDMAQDVNPEANPTIVPGDSAVIQVDDPVVGLDGDANTGWGPAVYTYVNVGNGAYAGSAIQATDLRNGNLRWPWVGDVSVGGTTYHVFRHDTCFTSGGGLVADRYCVDLNDDLFTPGDTLCFFYGAINTSAVAQYLGATEDHNGSYATGNISFAAANADECTILPAVGRVVGNDILYVDGMNFRGAQWTFDTSFQSMNIYDQVDRYDIRGPSSAVGNHPSSRVVNVYEQLSADNIYRKIIWNTGDLKAPFSDGDYVNGNDKSDDTGMLRNWMDNLPNTGGALRSGGLYLNGDDVAEEWESFVSASAMGLRTYMAYTVTNDDHVAHGVGVNPWVVGTVPGAFAHSGVPDTLVAYGGCPVINDFDVLEPTGAAVLEAEYVSSSGAPATGGAIVSQTTANPGGALIGFILSGFSFHYIRDYDHDGIEDRWHHLHDIITWLNNYPDPPIAAGPEGRRNGLAQNYPNPFNPTTMVGYTIKEAGHVSLKVYNVAGQLVKTLVNEAQNPKAKGYTVRWDGRNNSGDRAASGVYFYKLTAKNFNKTRKMVLLK